MRVLHLFSNWKFTGPADPVLILVASLLHRGVDASLAVTPTPSGEIGLDEVLARRALTTRAGLQLPKHTRALAALADVRRLRRWITEGEVECLHAHLPNDHLTAALATHRRPVPVIRTVYGDEPPSGFRARIACRATAGFITFSPASAARLQEMRPPPGGEVAVIEPAVDLERFRAGPERSWRERWGAAEGDMVIGVVARMQRHRLFAELIEGFTEAARDDPGLRLVLLGRGTHADEVARRPAARSTVSERIYFAGYLSHDDYPRALASFDVLLFLVPGSDGTCRAAREALVSGVPVLASRRGLLPHIVEDGATGLLLEEESPAAIAAAIRRLRRDPELRAALGRAAVMRARRRFDPEVQAERVAEIYERVLRGARA